MTDGKSGTMDLSGYQSDSSSSATSEFEKLERTDEAAGEPTAALPTEKAEEPKEEAGGEEKDATLESPNEEAEADAPKAEPKVEEETGDRPTEKAEEPTDEAAPGGGDGGAEIHPPAIGDQSISQAMDESAGQGEIAAQLSAHVQTAAGRFGRLFANTNVRIAAGVMLFAIVGYFVVQFGILPRMQQNDLQQQVDELQSKIKQYEQLLDAQEQAAKKLQESRFLFGKCFTFRFGLLERLGLLPAGGFRVCF